MNRKALGKALSCQLLALSFILALAAHSLADTREWLPRAGDVPQIDSITVAGTWADTNTVSITIGYDTLTVTLGSDTTTTAQVADCIKRAINASTIDENKVGAEKRNAAGQQLPAFRDVEAIIDPASASVVQVRSKVAGVPFHDAADVSAPFTLTASDTASGSATGAQVQAATGKKWWNNVANWTSSDTPDSGDLAIFRDTTVGPCYGLPVVGDDLYLLIDQYGTFVAHIGLPQNNPLGYSEYRAQSAVLTDGASNGASTWTFGIGPGAGSPLINFTYAGNTAEVTVNVRGTAPPAVAGKHALNLHLAGPTGADVTIEGGSVSLEAPVGGTGINIDKLRVSGTASVLYHNIADVCTLTVSGGSVTARGTGSDADTWTITGGEVVCENYGDSNVVTLNIYGGRVRWNSTYTLAAANVAGPGIFETGTRPFTATAVDIFKGATWLDPLGIVTYTAGIDYNRCDDSEVTVRVGPHKRRTVGAVP